jgi:hypothetical protein
MRPYLSDVNRYSGLLDPEKVMQIQAHVLAITGKGENDPGKIHRKAQW